MHLPNRIVTTGTIVAKLKHDHTPPHELEQEWRDLTCWPRSWMGLESDLPEGERLMDLFRPFLEYLTISGLSPKTTRNHIHNMWLLGGEFIRDLHRDPSRRKKTVDRVLQDMIAEGGPLLPHGGEEEQRSFDSTIRKFRKFSTKTSR